MKTIILNFIASVGFLIVQQPVFAQTEVAPFTASNQPSLVNAVFTEAASVSDFNCSIRNDKVVLNWNVAGNQMADRLIVQRSKDGKHFVMAGLVFGTDKQGVDSYQFYEKMRTKKKTVYRIIIIHKDKTVEYSTTTSLNNSRRNKNS